MDRHLVYVNSLSVLNSQNNPPYNVQSLKMTWFYCCSLPLASPHVRLSCTYLQIFTFVLAFPVAQKVKNLSAMWETCVQFLGLEDPREVMATHSSILAWRICMDREAWQVAVHGAQKVGHNWATKHSMSWLDFRGGTLVKNLPASAGDANDAGLIPVLGRYLGGGNGHPLQYSCLENSMGRGVWRGRVHGFQRLGHDLVTEQQVSHSTCIPHLYAFIYHLMDIYIASMSWWMVYLKEHWGICVFLTNIMNLFKIHIQEWHY